MVDARTLRLTSACARLVDRLPPRSATPPPTSAAGAGTAITLGATNLLLGAGGLTGPLLASLGLAHPRLTQAAIALLCLASAITIARPRTGAERSVKKTVIEHLGQLDFLHARENVILLGPPCDRCRARAVHVATKRAPSSSTPATTVGRIGSPSPGPPASNIKFVYVRPAVSETLS